MSTADEQGQTTPHQSPEATVTHKHGNHKQEVIVIIIYLNQDGGHIMKHKRLKYIGYDYFCINDKGGTTCSE